MVGKEGRRWFPLENGFVRDARVLDAGERASWLFIAILGHLSEHNQPGLITRNEIGALGITGWRPRLDRLIQSGLLEKRDETTFTIPSWDAWHAALTDHALYMREWRARQKRESR
jgi:hypothetical protein